VTAPWCSNVAHDDIYGGGVNDDDDDDDDDVMMMLAFWVYDDNDQGWRVLIPIEWHAYVDQYVQISMQHATLLMFFRKNKKKIEFSQFF